MGLSIESQSGVRSTQDVWVFGALHKFITQHMKTYLASYDSLDGYLVIQCRIKVTYPAELSDRREMQWRIFCCRSPSRTLSHPSFIGVNWVLFRNLTRTSNFSSPIRLHEPSCCHTANHCAGQKQERNPLRVWIRKKTVFWYMNGQGRRDLSSYRKPAVTTRNLVNTSILIDTTYNNIAYRYSMYTQDVSK